MSTAPITAWDAPRQCLPPHPPVHRTHRRLPEGACDTHFHIFGSYPLDPKRGYTPSPATIADYADVMAAYGITRAVTIQPSVFGFDNSALFDALGVMPDNLRGVAVIAPDAPDVVFERAHSLGVRGVRINPRNPAGLTLKDLAPLARRIEPLGWHIQFQIGVDDFPDIARIAETARIPIVIDHFGLPDIARGPRGAGFSALVELAASGGCFVKLSAPYRNVGGPGRYPLLAPFAERLVERAPDALLWALDWPHTECYDSVPDDGPMLDLVWDWLPSESLRRTVLCDNPTRLYWAPSPKSSQPRDMQR